MTSVFFLCQIPFLFFSSFFVSRFWAFGHVCSGRSLLSDTPKFGEMKKYSSLNLSNRIGRSRKVQKFARKVNQPSSNALAPTDCSSLSSISPGELYFCVTNTVFSRIQSYSAEAGPFEPIVKTWSRTQRVFAFKSMMYATIGVETIWC